MRRCALLLALLLGLLTAPARAWIDDGHRLVGLIALAELPPKVQAWVEALSASHPAPFSSFAEGCIWPDAAKGGEAAPYRTWHYIDTPWCIDGTPPVAADQVNVVWAIGHLVEEFKAGRATPQNLFLLGHFVGDIHQPLHCCEEVSQAHPKGNRGGNDNQLRPDMNLHLYWDSAAELFFTHPPEGLGPQVQELRKRFPRSSFAEELKRKHPDEWADESYDLACNFAYPWVDKPGYAELTRELCLRRIALAGYRLADLLQELSPP